MSSQICQECGATNQYYSGHMTWCSRQNQIYIGTSWGPIKYTNNAGAMKPYAVIEWLGKNCQTTVYSLTELNKILDIADSTGFAFSHRVEYQIG